MSPRIRGPAVLRPVRLHPALALFALPAILAVLPAPARAQDAALALELVGGASVPVASFSTGTAVGEGTDPGASFGLTFALTGKGRRTTYFGFSQHRFGCGDAGCDADGAYVSTGLNAGFRFALLRSGPVLPWISVGALTTRVESPGVTGSPAGVSSLGYGAEAGLGLYVGAGRSVALNPQLRFANVGVDLPGESRLTLRYVAASVALVLAF